MTKLDGRSQRTSNGVRARRGSVWGRWMCPLFYGRGTPCLSRGAPRSAYPLPMTSADTSARFVEAVEKANVGLFTELNGKKTVPSAWDPPPSGSLRVRRHPARNVPSPPGGPRAHRLGGWACCGRHRARHVAQEVERKAGNRKVTSSGCVGMSLSETPHPDYS